MPQEVISYQGGPENGHMAEGGNEKVMNGEVVLC